MTNGNYIEVQNFDDAYTGVINNILQNGSQTLNKRTGINVYEKFGQALMFDMNNYPLLTQRQMFPKTAAAELAWMLSGEKDVGFLQEYTNIWNDFVDKDSNEISTAYGYRWSHAFGVDQVQNIVDKLKKDPSSRQQILMSWDPRVDNVIPAKNVPCPYSTVFGIVDDKLHSHLSVRSNDIVIGFPYDAMVYTLLGQAMASELNIEPGSLFYTISNAHIYENHVKALDSVDTPAGEIFRARSSPTISDIRQDPHQYVKTIDTLVKDSGYGSHYKKIRFPINK